MTFPIPAGILTPEQLQAANFEGIVIGLLIGNMLLIIPVFLWVLKINAVINRPLNDHDAEIMRRAVRGEE